MRARGNVVDRLVDTRTTPPDTMHPSRVSLPPASRNVVNDARKIAAQKHRLPLHYGVPVHGHRSCSGGTCCLVRPERFYCNTQMVLLGLGGLGCRPGSVFRERLFENVPTPSWLMPLVDRVTPGRHRVYPVGHFRSSNLARRRNNSCNHSVILCNLGCQSARPQPVLTTRSSCVGLRCGALPDPSGHRGPVSALRLDPAGIRLETAASAWPCRPSRGRSGPEGIENPGRQTGSTAVGFFRDPAGKALDAPCESGILPTSELLAIQPTTKLPRAWHSFAGAFPRKGFLAGGGCHARKRSPLR